MAFFLCPKGGAIYLEVKINKEIRNYAESMFFGLSMRQFIFSVLACGVAVGLYFLLQSEFLMPKKILFVSDNLYYEALKPNIEAREKGLPATP